MHRDPITTFLFLPYIGLCIAEQRVLAGALSFPPGPGLEERGYCRPLAADQKFMANSENAGLGASHQQAESHQGAWAAMTMAS